MVAVVKVAKAAAAAAAALAMAEVAAADSLGERTELEKAGAMNGAMVAPEAWVATVALQ